jgi:membrane-bound lytic murein transglycosylase A
MKKTLAMLASSLIVALANPSTPALARIPLSPVNQNKLNAPLSQDNLLGLDDQLWGKLNQPADRQALLQSIDHSLRYLNTASAAGAYRKYQRTGITRDRVRRSLVRFRQLVLSSNSPEELQAAVKREFVFYQSVGKDNKGTVFFTAYYEPTYSASRTPTAEYRYPLYRLPPNFSKWPKPQPTRAELEGADGLQAWRGRLRGLELVWLRDRLSAFLVQIQGSARLQMTDGTEMTVGYAGKTNYPYTSIGREMAKDGKLPLDGLTLPVMSEYFKQNPNELNNYLPRQRAFVFFRQTHGAPATGSINVPVTPERSIATDKSLMPPGALALVHTRLAYPSPEGQIEQRLVSRYVLDQDTGSAIKGPGRVDYYMGTGKLAGDRAGVTGGSGQLYYLLLKE